jgi:hypothetical protein
MKVQYLHQFPTVSHRPGLFSNAFYNILNAIISVFTFAFALVAVFVVTANIDPHPFHVISPAFPYHSSSLWGHLEHVFRHLSSCGNHFHLRFHF